MFHRTESTLRTNLMIAVLVILASVVVPLAFARLNGGGAAAPAATPLAARPPVLRTVSSAVGQSALTATRPALMAARPALSAPTASATPAPTRTATATARATVTVTATAPPTAAASPTRAPTVTTAPTSTATATSAPTATVTPAPVAVRPSPTLTRPLAARPVPTQGAVAPRAVSPPALSAPPMGAPVSGVVRFSWLPTGPLPAGGGYEVVWWNRDEDPASARGFAPPTTGTFLDVNLDTVQAAGRFASSTVAWTVLVVQRTPYVRWQQPADGERGMFLYGATGGGALTSVPPSPIPPTVIPPTVEPPPADATPTPPMPK